MLIYLYVVHYITLFNIKSVVNFLEHYVAVAGYMSIL